MTELMRILIVAPEAAGLAPLAWASELTQVAEINGVEPVVCAGTRATRTAIGARLAEAWDVVLWSGHGAPGRLMAADGPVSAEWLACMMRQNPPGVVLLSACYSGLRDDSLHSIAESLSQSSITRVGMWVGVADRAAVVYDVEFLRAYVRGRSVALAHRVAVAQVAMEYPGMAGAAFLLPGLVNGYGKIEHTLRQQAEVLGAIEARLTMIERTLSIPDRGSRCSGGI
jgi:hypothetical protein